MREVPNWDDYFMGIAVAVSQRSKDPNTQVGAILVDENKHIVGTGYNGFTPQHPEYEEMWKRPQKYDLVIHAEMNAIAHAIASVKGCDLYVTLHPCLECAKLIATSGIKNVFFMFEKNNDSECKGYRLLRNSGVFVKQLDRPKNLG